MNPTPARAATSSRVSSLCVNSHDSAPSTGASTGAGGSVTRLPAAIASSAASATPSLRSQGFLSESLDVTAAEHGGECGRGFIVGLGDLANHLQQLEQSDGARFLGVVVHGVPPARGHGTETPRLERRYESSQMRSSQVLAGLVGASPGSSTSAPPSPFDGFSESRRRVNS